MLRVCFEPRSPERKKLPLQSPSRSSPLPSLLLTNPLCVRVRVCVFILFYFIFEIVQMAASIRQFSQIWLKTGYESKKSLSILHIFGYILESNREIWQFFHITKKRSKFVN